MTINFNTGLPDSIYEAKATVSPIKEAIEAQPEALWLATKIEEVHRGHWCNTLEMNAATELRRQHAEIAQLTAALAALRSMPAEPVATLWVQMETHDMGQSLAPNPPFKAAIAKAHTAAKDLPLGEYLLYATPPSAATPEPSDAERLVLAYLDDLKDGAAAHIWPDDLERCMTSECVVQVASVRMGSPDGTTVPLFSRDQVAEAFRATKGGKL